MRRLPSICFAAGAIGLLGAAGCTTRISETHDAPSEYSVNATYVTTKALPAIVSLEDSPGPSDSVVFLRNRNVDPMGGKIAVIDAGTKILVVKVWREEDPELGTIVRVFARVASGPHMDAVANLYDISIQERNPRGGMNALMRDPALLSVSVE